MNREKDILLNIVRANKEDVCKSIAVLHDSMVLTYLLTCFTTELASSDKPDRDEYLSGIVAALTSVSELSKLLQEDTNE